MANSISNLTIKANVSPAVNELDRLKNKTRDVGGAFDGLKNAIAGIAIGAFAKSAIDAASAMQNFANATGISISVISGYSQAMIAAGGSADRARDGISDLTKNIGEAARGSLELQKAFKLANVSIEDLRTLSEQDILRKTIDGLSKIPDSATRTATAFKIMGESVKGVDLTSLNNELDKYITKNAGSSTAIAAAAEAQKSFSNNIQNLQLAVLQVIEPLNKIAAGVDISAEAFAKVIRIVGLAVASYLTLTKVLPAVTNSLGKLGATLASGGGFWASTRAQIAATGAQLGFFSKNAQRSLGLLPSRFGGVTSAVFALRNAMGFLLRAFGIAGIIYTVVDAVNELIKAFTGFDVLDWVFKKIKLVTQALTDFLGLTSEVDRKQDEYNKNEIERFKNRAEAQKKQLEQVKENRKIQDETLKKINELFNAEMKGVNEVTNGYARTVEQLKKKFELETSLIGLSERQKQVTQQLFDAEAAFTAESIKLSERLAEQQRLKVSGNEEEAAAAKRLIPEIQAAQAKLTATYEAQKKSIDGLVAAREAAAAAQQLELFATRQQIEQQNKLQAIVDDTAKITMTELEKKYYDISTAARDSAKAAIEAEQARRGEPLSTAEIQAYYQTAYKGAEELIKATKKQAETQRSYQRSFSTGWRESLTEYVDNVGNAAQRAKDLFGTATKGMEDLFMKFINTGKFEWKGFVQSIVNELLRSQVQQLIAKVFGGITSVGTKSSGSNNFLGQIGSLLGFANGGIIPTNGPVLVGERGPEILSGAAGRQVTPNNQLGGANITYNINAVDAMSFKQMVARDPSFLYAVSEQGRRKLGAA